MVLLKFMALSSLTAKASISDIAEIFVLHNRYNQGLYCLHDPAYKHNSSKKIVFHVTMKKVKKNKKCDISKEWVSRHYFIKKTYNYTKEYEQNYI